jgi:hypothetical protein
VPAAHLHAAREKIKDDTGLWNKSLATPKLEQQEAPDGTGVPQKVPQQKQTAQTVERLSR